MKTRVLTGLAIVGPAFYLLGWSPKWLFMAVMVLLAERGLFEYFSVSQKSGVITLRAAGYAAAAALCVLQWASLSYSRDIEFVGLVALLVLIPSLSMWRMPDLKQYLGCAAGTLFGVFYAAFCLSCLFPLRFSGVGAALANGREIVFFLFVVITAGDIFAYFTGRLFGRRLIFPRLSPKKTLEGALGGLAASVVLGWAFTRWFWHATDAWIVLLLAFCVAIAGQTGDLVESALKRGAGLKDSGNLLPGHGGLLDRVDSLLLGAPVLWLMLVLKDIRW